MCQVIPKVSFSFTHIPSSLSQGQAHPPPLSFREAGICLLACDGRIGSHLDLIQLLSNLPVSHHPSSRASSPQLGHGGQRASSSAFLASQMSPDLEPKVFSRLFTHSFNKYFLSTWYVLGTVPGAGNTAVNTADEAIVLLEGTMN